jgi:tRNA pseudouridine55 synthase
MSGLNLLTPRTDSMDSPRTFDTNYLRPANRRKTPRHPVHGVLLLDKPKWMSSNDALQKAKWLYNADKAGHTGTLDPMATGVLPLCFGSATKFSQLALDAYKSYEATLRLGIKTSTGDVEGEIIDERRVTADDDEIAVVLKRFTGQIEQVPPMHSALKRAGRPLYEYAREGIEVDREPRSVHISSIEALCNLSDEAPHCFRIQVRCSKGTYIRTLAEDIGEALCCGAHLINLRRIETAGFEVDQCISLTALEAMTEGERMAALMPPEALLSNHKRVVLNADNASRFLTGMRRKVSEPDAAEVAVFSQVPHFPISLLGTAHIKAGELIPDRLLTPVEVSQHQFQLQSLPQK